MAEVNWQLGQGNSALAAFQTGFQIGDQIRQGQVERKTSNALAGLVADPAQDEAKFAELIKGLPIQSSTALINARQGMLAQKQQQERSRLADLPLVGRLLNGVTDENSYQQARSQAQQYGIDLSGAPANYDPAWIDQQKTTVQALSTPQGQAALSTAGKIAQDEGLRPGTPEFGARVTQIWKAENQKTIPYTAGGGVASVDPTTGGVSTLIAPNTVGAQAGSPVPQPSNLPRITDPMEAKRLPPGSQFILPDGRIGTVPGGASSNAGGGFR